MTETSENLSSFSLSYIRTYYVHVRTDLVLQAYTYIGAVAAPLPPLLSFLLPPFFQAISGAKRQQSSNLLAQKRGLSLLGSRTGC